MKRTLVATGLIALLLLVAAPAVIAATFDEVAGALASDGYYIEPNAEPVDEQELASIVRNSETGLRVVLLAGSPPEGATPLADNLLNDVGDGTVVVVTPEDIGASTSRADPGAVDQAFDRTEEQVDSVEDLLGYLTAFDQALADEAGRSGGLSTGTILLVGGIVVLGGIALFKQFRTRRSDREQRERSLREAREEVRGQVGTLADRILALNDQVELAGDDKASRLYAAATETYTSAQNHLEASSSVAELEGVSDELDHARWQLESVTALLEGREPPPEPEKEAACFFDPNHGAGVEESLIDTAAGQQKVRVCSFCAAKLRAGEAPEPRMIEVGGQRMPAAMAPRSYGGGGLSWLADFALILGGRRYPYGWGGYRGYGYPHHRRRWYGGGRSRGGWGGGSRSRSISTGRGSRSRWATGGRSRSRSISRGTGRRSRGGRSRRR